MPNVLEKSILSTGGKGGEKPFSESHAWVNTFHSVPDTGAVGEGRACPVETQSIDLVWLMEKNLHSMVNLFPPANSDTSNMQQNPLYSNHFL